MSDKLVLADNSMSDNATTVERKCLTGYRALDECPTKQQLGNSVHEGDQRDELERILEVQSAGGLNNPGRDSTASLPYSMNGCETFELFLKVFTAPLLTRNHKRNDIHTLVEANYLLGITNRMGKSER